MGKKAVLKFFIFTFYAVSGVITLLLLCLPAWDNKGTSKVGIFLEDNENSGLKFGYMPNSESNQSSIYQLMVYTVIYLLIVAILNIALIGFASLDSNKVAKWLHVIICCAHATGLVFIFLIYSIRYIAEFVAPLRNYYLTIFGILVDFILILLLIMYKRKKNVKTDEVPDIIVEGGEVQGEELSKIDSRKSTIKKNNSKNPQLISEGNAVPLYYGGQEIVEHQPTVKPVIDESKIVVSDNIVGNNSYLEGNGNQFQYSPNQQIEIATTYAQPTENIQSPPYNAVNNQKLNSQYTYNESNPYPVAHDTVYKKIPEVPSISKKEETQNDIFKIPEVPTITKKYETK